VLELTSGSLSLGNEAGLLSCISAASAQTPGVSPCTWCVNQVVVGPSGGNLEWKEIRMDKGVNDATILKDRSTSWSIHRLIIWR